MRGCGGIKPKSMKVQVFYKDTIAYKVVVGWLRIVLKKSAITFFVSSPFEEEAFVSARSLLKKIEGFADVLLKEDDDEASQEFLMWCNAGCRVGLAFVASAPIDSKDELKFIQKASDLLGEGIKKHPTKRVSLTLLGKDGITTKRNFSRNYLQQWRQFGPEIQVSILAAANQFYWEAWWPKNSQFKRLRVFSSKEEKITTNAMGLGRASVAQGMYDLQVLQRRALDFQATHPTYQWMELSCKFFSPNGDESRNFFMYGEIDSDIWQRQAIEIERDWQNRGIRPNYFIAKLYALKEIKKSDLPKLANGHKDEEE